MEMQTDTFFSAEEAIDMGLIDGVVGRVKGGGHATPAVSGVAHLR